MIRLYAALVWGHFRRHRLEFLLCFFGVALGVAVVVAIDSAVAACVGSFSAAVESLAQRSTHGIFAQAGRITDQQYIDLLDRKLAAPLAPMIDRGVLASSGNEPPLVARLIGVDVFSERSLRSFTQFQQTLDEATRKRFLTQPNQVVLVDVLAEKLGARAGGTIHLVVGSRKIDANVCGVIALEGVARAQLPDLIIADLATAQEFTNSIGQLDRIDTRLDTDAQREALEAALPSGLELRSTQQQSASLGDLIASYRMNLSALSLMASFVAIFIVYNSMLISVRQRRASLGVLRSLGASRLQLGGIYLIEAMVFAVVGAAVGTLAGAGLSRLMVGYIATTINDLYASVRPEPITIGPMLIAKGTAVAVASCIVGAAVPLLAAAQSPPISALRPTAAQRRSGKTAFQLLWAGLALLASAVGVELLPGGSPIAGFVMALLIALGFALVCPWITQRACAAVAKVAQVRQWLPLQLAAASVDRALGITGVAVAATMLAMAMNISVRTMVFSFRSALASWMEQRFAADIFVGPELLVRHKIDATIDPQVVTFIAGQPEVRHVIPYSMHDIMLGTVKTSLTSTDVAAVMKTLPMKSALGDRAGFRRAADLLISEPLAGRAHLSAGDSLELQTPVGSRQFRIYGVFFDFGTERGQAMIDASTYAPIWHDPRINSLHVELADGLDADALAAKWSAALRADFPVIVSSSRDVKQQVLAMFDRTFAVTEVLTWLAGGVAFCGLAGALLALTLARQRDYSVLAAIGMSGRQTLTWIVGQGGVIAGCAALVACVAGTMLAYVLAYVIQYRSFGWSIPTHAQPRFWLQNLLLALAAALVAAIYPALLLRRTPPAGGLRYE